MKKLLSILSVLLVLFACKKEKPADDTPSGGDPSTPSGPSVSEISSITLPSSLLLLDKEKTGGLLEVKLSPSGCSTEMLNVKVKPEDVVSWSLKENGVFFTPKKIGEASVTLSAKSGPASSVEATVRVLSSEDYAATDINGITINPMEVYLQEGDTYGKTVKVTLDPPSATTDMLTFSGAEDIVSVKAESGVLRFTPKKVGTGSVLVKARRGSANPKSIPVVVLAKDAYSDYVIQTVTFSPTSVVVTDEAGADNNQATVHLTISPSGAALKDLIIASADKTVATVSNGDGTNIVVSGMKPGNTKIIVKGIREGSTTVEIPVTVYGHVTGIDFNAGDKMELVGTTSSPAYYTLVKTGPLQSDPEITWTATGNLVSVSSTGTVTPKKAGGGSTYDTVKAAIGKISASIKVYVYDYPTRIEYDTPTGAGEQDGQYYNLKKGETCTITWRVLPSTAKQEYKTITLKSGSVDASSCLTTTKVSNGYKTTIKADRVKKESFSLAIDPVNSSKSTTKVEKVIYFSEYYSTDVKPGDYVYYDSSSKRFNWSDGGIRICIDLDNFRYVTKSKQTSLGTFIGKVYTESVPDGDAAWKALSSKPGFKNNAGKHACVLSAYEAHENGRAVEYWRWSIDSDNVKAMNDWKNGPYPNTGSEFEYKLQIIHYNSKSGDSHKIRPGYCVTGFDTATFGSISDYSTLTHTGWMLATRGTAEWIVRFNSGGAYSRVFSDFDNTIRESWTCEQYSSDEAWYFNFSSVGHKVKAPGDKSQKPYVRPVLWL